MTVGAQTGHAQYPAGGIFAFASRLLKSVLHMEQGSHLNLQSLRQITVSPELCEIVYCHGSALIVGTHTGSSSVRNRESIRSGGV
jgi:hypothetical protein